MAEQKLLTGRVYDIGKYEQITGKSMHSDEYFQRIGQIARDFFSHRNQIPQTAKHDGVIDTVNCLVVEHMSSYATAGLKFLDVGGSTGKRILDIDQKFRKKYGFGLEKYVTDIDDISCKAARARGIHARQLNIAEERLPFEDETFDSVGSFWTFELLPPEKHTHLIKEIYRTLKPKGTFYWQDDKQGMSDEQKRYFKEVLEPRGYKPGTFFLGVFEISDWSRVQISTTHIHPVSDLDPEATLIGEPMYVKGFSLSEIDELAKDYFDMKRTSLIEFAEGTAGKVIASNREQAEKSNDRWSDFLAVLRKK